MYRIFHKAQPVNAWLCRYTQVNRSWLAGGTNYSQNLRTFEELYDESYIKADSYSVTKSMLGGDLLDSSLLRAVLKLCPCLEDKCGLYASVAMS